MAAKGKNAFLAKQAAVRQAYVEASENITRQMMVDSMIVVLNEEFGFGYDRIKRTMDALIQRYDAYHAALEGGPEADYTQEKIDAALRRIVRDREPFHPFAERYPEIKAITYDKKQ